MPEINDLILNKLTHYAQEVRKLATAALELSEKGASESQMVEQLHSMVRSLVRKENAK